MKFENYDFGSIKKGIENPHLVKDELERLWKQNLEPQIYNTAKYITERNNNSRYGFVVHWSFYKQDRWGIAQTPYVTEAILDEFEPLIITTQRSYEENKEDLDFVISYYPGFSAPKIKLDSEQEHTSLVITSDPHDNVESREQYFVENDIAYVLSHYYHPFKRHFSQRGKYELIHFPWAIPDQYVVKPDDIQYTSEKITILGDYRGEAYETRDWCAQFSFVHDDYKERFKNKIYSGGDYYRWLRNFDAVVAANSLSDDFRYVTAKFMEIPAAGALLFAQYSEDLELLGFNEDNCLIFTKENFEQKADAYTEDPEAYVPTRKRGAELIHDRHKVSDRIAKIRSLLNDDSSV